VGVPYAGLVGQVLARSARPLELLEGLSARPAHAELALRVLLQLCRRGPLVWAVDDADLASGGGLWADLVLGLADRVSRDLPLVLILGVDGPQELGGHEDDEPDSLYVARELSQDQRALWLPLMPVGLERLRAFTGPASWDVLDSLLEITGGEAEWAGALWREWQRRGVVEDVPTANWRFATDGREAMLDEVGALLAVRLKQSVGDELSHLVRAREILTCAALEGRRFTAPAIADALDLDRDVLIDFIDDARAVDDQHPERVLVEDGWVHIRDERGERLLAMYRFARALDWVTLAHYGFTEDRQRVVAQRLADALATQYGGQDYRVAHPLARLYTLATIPDRAGHYRRMADIGTNRQIIVWRARELPPAEPADRSERRRESQILIAAANALAHTGPYADGLAFAEAAQRLAPLKGDQAQAQYLSAVHRNGLGDYESARSDCVAALQMCRELGDRHTEASARHQLAMIDYARRDLERARTECVDLIELRRDLGDRAGEANTRHLLALIEGDLGDPGRARSELVVVLDLWRKLENLRGEAAARLNLAILDSREGDHEAARNELLALLELWRELRDRQGEARTRYELALVEYNRGDRECARSELVAVVELCREIGNRGLEMGALNSLRQINGASNDLRA
jgi:tetratricopeptide (TPR) repeat protein